MQRVILLFLPKGFKTPKIYVAAIFYKQLKKNLIIRFNKKFTMQIYDNKSTYYHICNYNEINSNELPDARMKCIKS